MAAYVNTQFPALFQTIHQDKSERVRYKCNQCPQSFALKTGLCKHIRTHHKDRVVYPCSLCDKVFKVVSGLKYHNQVHHRTQDSPTYSCGKCEYSSFVKASLTAHYERVHDRVKRQVCYFCGKRWYNFPELVRHIKSHTLEG
ncbi:Zinc finger and SCAN domain-containing protein 26 [Folsomia candida]|uniref:Zinc finger and SCAN domain-containing protein 26 n=1 Tax=Folsomia candida TaxID=158441 RepID=A0A226DLS3_FOLCA|nr:Zinc finger and SCAN domain-containing protein 26 [Folsomia candida]